MSGQPPPRSPPDMRGAVRTYWEGAARGVLLLPHCAVCAETFWPPRARCPVCAATVAWREASGRGVVHTFTVVRQASQPAFEAQVPYVVAMIELAEGPRLMSRIVGCGVDAVHIGMPVRVMFADAGDGLVVPMFAPDGGAK